MLAICTYPCEASPHRIPPDATPDKHPTPHHSPTFSIIITRCKPALRVYGDQIVETFSTIVLNQRDIISFIWHTAGQSSRAPEFELNFTITVVTVCPLSNTVVVGYAALFIWIMCSDWILPWRQQYVSLSVTDLLKYFSTSNYMISWLIRLDLHVNLNEIQ